MGDVDRGHAEIPLQPRDLSPHLNPELCVEVRERLVHQERLWLANDRSAHRDALALAARERARPFVQRLHEAKDAGRVCHPRLDLSLRKLPHSKREPHVPGRRHVGVEGVVLEDHRDVAIFRRNPVDDPAADPDLAVGDVLEPCHHAERAGLAAAGRADQDDELTVCDLQIKRFDGFGAVWIDLRQLLQLDLGHAAPAKRLRVGKLYFV